MKAILILIQASFFFLISSCNFQKEDKSTSYKPIKLTTTNQVERGKLLVNAIGCHDCHSPKKFTESGMHLDETKILSGHPSDEKVEAYDKATTKSWILFSMGGTAHVGPWGTSFAANLTPDDTGIGNWSEQQFLNSIKKGKYKGLDGSRDLLPLMPWEAYRNLPDEDLKAIFSYLKTIKPINNIVPAAIPPQTN